MSVRKKGDKWYCRFQIDGVRYERRCPLAVDERTALQAEKIIATEIMRGNLNFAKAIKKTTVKDGLKILKTHSETNKLSFRDDYYIIEKFREFFGDSKPLDSISSTDINNFKDFLRTKNITEKIKVPNPDYGKKGVRKQFIYKEVKKTITVKDATINRRMNTISKMFSLCIKEGLITKNPCTLAGRFREENYKIRYLSSGEEERLFNAITPESEYMRPIIITALQTGMRKSEILSLKWSQVDFRQGFIDVLKSKSGKERKIPISSKLDKVLRTLYAVSDSDYVFINPVTSLPYVDIKKSFNSLINRAGIVNFRFHDLRHTVATRMVESGIDLVVVKEILGHSKIETTMRYAHPVPERKKLAVECL